MRITIAGSLLGTVALLASCASPPIALAPVGPRPVAADAYRPASGTGQLQVFTQSDAYNYGDSVPFYPHRDYQIFNPDGLHLKRVWNAQTHEDETPAVVTLPAGNYVVRADAELYGSVSVPVAILPGRTTRLILQPGWNPGTEVADTAVVRMPDGYPVGWSAEPPRP